MENPILPESRKAEGGSTGTKETVQLPQNVAQHHGLILPVTLLAFLPCENSGLCTTFTIF